jgi:hypothetical protein
VSSVAGVDVDKMCTTSVHSRRLIARSLQLPIPLSRESAVVDGPVWFAHERVSSMNNQTRGKLLFLVAAFLSFLLSIVLWFSGHHDEGVFVGIWVPSILALGALMLGSRGSR